MAPCVAAAKPWLYECVFPAGNFSFSCSVLCCASGSFQADTSIKPVGWAGADKGHIAGVTLSPRPAIVSAIDGVRYGSPRERSVRPRCKATAISALENGATGRSPDQIKPNDRGRSHLRILGLAIDPGLVPSWELLSQSDPNYVSAFC